MYDALKLLEYTNKQHFQLSQTKFGKIFWSVVVILLLALGLYWCADVYQAWTDQPVLTTIKTAELPVQEVFLHILINN
jgi:hypothetical protein